MQHKWLKQISFFLRHLAAFNGENIKFICTIIFNSIFHFYLSAKLEELKYLLEIFNNYEVDQSALIYLLNYNILVFYFLK